MSKAGWIKKALHRGELRITDDRFCPFCNPEHRADKKAVINACEYHKWVYREWFGEWFRNRFPDEYEAIAKSLEKQR